MYQVGPGNSVENPTSDWKTTSMISSQNNNSMQKEMSAENKQQGGKRAVQPMYEKVASRPIVRPPPRLGPSSRSLLSGIGRSLAQSNNLTLPPSYVLFINIYLYMITLFYRTLSLDNTSKEKSLVEQNYHHYPPGYSGKR